LCARTEARHRAKPWGRLRVQMQATTLTVGGCRPSSLGCAVNASAPLGRVAAATPASRRSLPPLTFDCDTFAQCAPSDSKHIWQQLERPANHRLYGRARCNTCKRRWGARSPGATTALTATCARHGEPDSSPAHCTCGRDREVYAPSNDGLSFA